MSTILSQHSLKEFMTIFGSKTAKKRVTMKDGTQFCFFTIGTEDVMIGQSISEDVEKGNMPHGSDLQVVKVLNDEGKKHWTLCRKHTNAEVLDDNVSFEF